MTIKEVERLTGITRQNIRFYEREGLINPGRNPENQYREYSEEDVAKLNEIKLYRKLDIPIEAIRKLYDETLSLHSCMDQCISTMEREMSRMSKTKEICNGIKKCLENGAVPDTGRLLAQIEAYEKKGCRFHDISRDYLDDGKVMEIRTFNCLAAESFLCEVLFILAGAFLYSGVRWEWILCFPFAVIGFGWPYLRYFRKNPEFFRKHLRLQRIRPAVLVSSAVTGVAFYFINLLISLMVTAVFPIRPTEFNMTVLNAVILFLALPVQNVLFVTIWCGLAYDIYKQKSIVSALGLSAVLFGLTYLELRSAAILLIFGITLCLLHELTDSILPPVAAAAGFSLCGGMVLLTAFLFPGLLPAYLTSNEISGTVVAAVFPWFLLTVIFVGALLYLIKRLTGRKIEWKLEWERQRIQHIPLLSLPLTAAGIFVAAGILLFN